MKYVLSAALIGATVTMAVPSYAQGVYIGPGGVGVDTGIRRHHDFYGDRDRDYYRGDRPYEGRSVYRDGPSRFDRDRY